MCLCYRGADCVEVLGALSGRQQRIEVHVLVGRIARYMISLQSLPKFSVALSTTKMLCARMEKDMLNLKGNSRVCV